MEDLSEKVFGQYRIIATLGEGGMAAVYRAVQASIGREVAVKVLPKAFASEPQFVVRFKREAQALAQLQHPHILEMIDFGEADGYTFIVMPLLRGGTLARRMARGIPMPEALRFANQICEALDYAHKDKNGIATKTEAKNYNAFKTRKGRTVYDGGGIQPDVEMEETKSSAITEALQKKDGIFNYVTTYYYKNPNLGNQIPTFSDADFQDFKQYLKANKFSFDTETELALKNTLAAAKKEKIDESINPEYQQLFAALQKSEETALDKNQKEIKNLIVDEIIKRYQYQEGLYQYYLKNNLEIKKAVNILNNNSEYKSILKM